jgi:glycosyltransferase involved in cell wall biosynthesis
MPQHSLPALHVVVVNDYCHVQGGASRVAIDEAVGLADAGAYVTFLGAVGPVCEELNKSPLQVVNLNQSELSAFRRHPGNALHSLWNQTAYNSMKGVLRPLPQSTTVVHIHGYTKALSSSPARYAMDQGFKVVCTLHDFFSACPNGAFFNFIENQPCKLRPLSWSCIGTNCDKRSYAQKLYRIARSSAQRRLGHFPAGVRDYLALSNTSADVLRPYLPTNSKFHFLANPISVRWETPVDVAARDAIVAIGRLDTEKGTKILVDAARGTGSRLVLVGDGPWRHYAEKYEGCKVTGWLSRPQAMAELERARCLVFPSLWYETFGLVIDEAAARGVPSIVSDISAAAERVKNEITGWHFRTGDVSDLVRCLTLIKDGTNVKRAGLAAFESYWANPSTPSRHAAALTAIYREILAR